MSLPKVRFFDLFDTAIQWVRKDPLVVVPCTMFFAVAHVVQTQFFSDIKIDNGISFMQIQMLASIWALNLLFITFVLTMGQGIFLKGHIDLGESLRNGLKRFVPVLVANASVLLPVIGFFWLVLGDTGLSDNPDLLESTGLLLINLVLLLISLIVVTAISFIPYYIIISHHTIFGSISHSFSLIKRHIGPVIRILVFSNVVKLVGVFSGLLFAGIPIVGESLILILFKGLSHTISYLMLLKFYHLFNRNGQIVVTV